MTDKPFDPFDFVDDDFVQAVVEVAESLPDWKPDSDLVKQASSPIKILAAQLREGRRK